MWRVARALGKGKYLDVFLLIVFCVIAASHWYDHGWPEGHDAIGITIEAVNLDHLLHTYGSLLGHISAFDLNPKLLSFVLSLVAHQLGFTTATKIVFLLILALSAVLAYYYAYEITSSRPSSFTAALAYVFAPCLLIEVVFEGHWSVGAGYALTPLLFLLTEKAIQRPEPGRVILAGLSLALLIAVGHPQTFPLLVGPFWVLYVALRVWQSGRVKYRATATASLAIALIGLSLTAFWWMPLLREARYFHSTYSSMEEAAWYSASLDEALTLRPVLCCAPDSAYGASGGLGVKILQTVPFLLALLGIITNLRNRYIWIFSALAILSLVLALGPSSPNSLFWFAHSYLPFFQWIRTPSRFLLFLSFAYAALIGFFTKAMVDWLKGADLGRIRLPWSHLGAVALVALIIVGNTWHEAREGFSTFTLPPDRSNSLSFLTDQPNGDYRIADASFDTEAYDSQMRSIVNPTYWVFAHGKETTPGGMPQTSTYAADTIGYLREALEASKVNMSQWFSILNVKYVVVNKNDTLSLNVILNDGFELVWPSDTIDIYENHNVMPKVFLVSLTNERPLDLWRGDDLNVSRADGSVNSTLSLDTEHATDHTLKVGCAFTEPGPDSTSLAINVEGIDFSSDDVIHLTFYTEKNLPDICMCLELLEQDGTKYGMELYCTDGIKAGWNEINFPISLLTLRDSIDENNQLDPDQIQTLRFGPAELGNHEKKHEFSLYFDAASVVTQVIDTSVEYTRIRPGKYVVHVNSDSPSCLVLSESYHPNWAARINSQWVDSQLTYEALNGFNLQAGEYDVTLEFRTSSLRTAGNIVTLVSLLLLCSTVAFLLVRNRRSHSSRSAGAHVKESV